MPNTLDAGCNLSPLVIRDVHLRVSIMHMKRMKRGAEETSRLSRTVTSSNS